MTTPPVSWIGRDPTCQRRGMKMFEVTRQMQNDTAIHTNVADRPGCPADALVLFMILVFKVVYKHTRSGSFRTLTQRYPTFSNCKQSVIKHM